LTVERWQNIFNFLSSKQKKDFISNVLQNNFSYNSNDETLNKMFTFYKEKI